MNNGDTLINGQILKQFYGDTGYIALIEEENCYNFFGNIRQGWNEKKLTKSEYGCNVYYGGLEFIKEDEFYKMIVRVSEYDNYWILDIPDDAKVHVEESNFLTDKFNALERKDLKDLPSWKNKDICLKAVKQCGKLLKYVDIDGDKDTMEKIYDAAINQDRCALKFVPKEYQTESMCMKLLKDSIHVFKYIKNPTNEMRLYVVSKNGQYLEDIDPIDQTKDIIWEAIRQNEYAIKFATIQSEGMCKYIVRQSGYLLKFIKKENQTEEICEIACENNPIAIEYAEYQTLDICKKVLLDDMKLFKYIKKITKEICKFAIKIEPKMIRQIGEVTPEMYKIAIRQDPFVLKYIKNQTKEMCESALYLNPMSIKFVKIQTEDMCTNAIKRNPKTLQYCKYQPNDIIEDLVKRDGRYLKYIKPKNQTEIICIYSILSTPESIKYVHKQTKKNVKRAIKENGLLLKFIKDEFKTHKIIQLALINPKALEFVDQDKHTDVRFLIEDLLKKDGMVLEHVKDKTQEHCNIALNNNIDAIKFVPEEYQTIEMGWKALLNNINNIAYIKKQTKQMGTYVINKDGGLLSHVKHKTSDMCMDAVMKNPWSIMDIEDDLKTDDILLAAISVDPSVINSIKYKSDTFYMLSMIMNSNAEEYITNYTINSINKKSLYKQIIEESDTSGDSDDDIPHIESFNHPHNTQQHEEKVINLFKTHVHDFDNDNEDDQLYCGYYS